ncbi:MAG: tRNA (guanosine(46)-N7)-methyltransferase TrmB [Planctomycetes bacterium]|nr:tRNA (guanosine(46)-N7)-methyltransferase TrmB [Planctomycetota bacterium]
MSPDPLVPGRFRVPEDLILQPPEGGWTVPPDWSAVFGRKGPLAVEIGPGKGIFLARIAAAHPELDFLAIELRRQRCILCCRKILAARLGNARLIEGPAESLVRPLFAPGSVRIWYVNFPDPWPKRKQKKHRIVQPPFVRDLAQTTEPGGIAYLATDDADYAGQILEVFEADGSWENAHGPGRWSDTGGEHSRTTHEEKFLKWGRSIRYFQFVRRA